MKRFLITLMIVFLLCGCASDKSHEKTNPDDRYYGMIDSIRDYDNFLNRSSHFNIEAEIAEIDGGYRFYVIVDKPRIAMYDVEIIAIEQGVDYTKNMAANIGVFDEKQYNMIPNQSSPEKGFVSGLVASGTTNRNDTDLYVLVQWKTSDLNTTKREYFKLNVSGGDDND